MDFLATANDGLGSNTLVCYLRQIQRFESSEAPPRPDERNAIKLLLDDGRTKVELTPVAGRRIVFLHRDLIPALLGAREGSTNVEYPLLTA